MLALFTVLLMAACANPFSGGGAGDVLLVNRTDRALLYLALPRADAAVVDPNPAWNPQEHLDRMVAAGEERWIDVEGSAADGVVLFLYAVPPADMVSPVPLWRVLAVEGGELRRMSNRVVVQDE